MSLILKKTQHLTLLFKSLTLRDALIVNKNINETEYLLKVPSKKARQLMAEQSVPIEDLLADRCMALTRFYLSDEKKQLKYFLNSERLALLFTELPMAEATVFQKYLRQAKDSLTLPDIPLQNLLQSEGLINQLDAEDELEIMQDLTDLKIGYQQQTYLQYLQRLAATTNDSEEKNYKNCFYELQVTSVEVDNGKEHLNSTIISHSKYQQGLAFYCELTPLLQLKAQQLFKKLNKAEVPIEFDS